MKKGIIALLIVAIVCSFACAFAATFSDVPEDMWAYKQIEKWADENIVVGYEDGTYKPQNLITRAEFATIVVKLFNPEKVADLSKYTDVKTSDWFYDNMAKAVGMGAIEEVTSTTMRPNAYVTRQEAVVILNSIIKFAPARKDAIKDFADYDEIADYAEDDVEVFSEREYVIGYPDGTFRPADTITRAEAATILDRIFKLIITKPGTYDCDGINVNQFVIVKSVDVVLKNSDQANIIYLNDTVKKDTEGPTDAAKAVSVVINPGTSGSKTTGRTSGGGSGTSTNKTLVINVKDNGDMYAVTSNGVKLKDGGKYTIKVNGDTIVNAAKASKDDIADNLLSVLDAIAPKGDLDRMDRMMKTLDNGKYGEKDRLNELGQNVLINMVADGAVTLADDSDANTMGEIKSAAGGTGIFQVYSALSDDTKLAIKGYAVEEGTNTYLPLTDDLYNEVLTKLSSF